MADAASRNELPNAHRRSRSRQYPGRRRGSPYFAIVGETSPNIPSVRNDGGRRFYTRWIFICSAAQTRDNGIAKVDQLLRDGVVAVSHKPH